VASVTIEQQVGRQSLFWLIAVSEQFEIIPAELSGKLDELRKERNKVHLRQHAEIGQVAYTNQSKKAFELTEATVTATKSWKTAHPAPQA